MKTLLKHIRQLHPVVLDTEGKFIFFGIRKCCLHSVYRDLLKLRAMTYRDCRNLWTYRLAITDVNKIFKFTIVRNPWDRMVSAFYALQQAGRPCIGKGETFQHFMKTTFCDKGILCDPHFEHQYPRVYFKGQVFVDFVARIENIKKDWEIIASAIDCSPVLPHKNRSQHGPYRDYYDDECIDIVYNVYRKDVELLGYEF